MNNTNKKKLNETCTSRLTSLLKTILLQLIFIYERMSKYLLHLITRKCELERICSNEKIESIRIKKIENSLRNSSNNYLRSLVRIDNDYPEIEDDIVVNIMQIKNIPQENATFSFIMKDSLIKINAYYNLIREIDFVRNQKFSHDDSKHAKLLVELWTGLVGDQEKIDSCKSKKWKEIGFQGDDPSTDFRGMGMLALNSLNYLVTNHNDIAKNLYFKSQHPKYGYSFAIVGINVIAWCYKLLVDGDLRTHFYHFSEFLKTDKITMENFYRIFISVFMEFNEFWFKKEPENIMQFEQLSKEFVLMIKNRLSSEPYTHINDILIERKSFLDKQILIDSKGINFK